MNGLPVEENGRSEALEDATIFRPSRLGHYSWPELSRIIHMTTGLTWGKEEIRTMTRWVVSLCRKFNLWEGMTRKGDCLPSRFHKEALPESGKVITEDELNRLIKDYYRLQGWE
jgi:aldehyde:ferredoxin oxidoreductase